MSRRTARRTSQHDRRHARDAPHATRVSGRSAHAHSLAERHSETAAGAPGRADPEPNSSPSAKSARHLLPSGRVQQKSSSASRKRHPFLRPALIVGRLTGRATSTASMLTYARPSGPSVHPSVQSRSGDARYESQNTAPAGLRPAPRQPQRHPVAACIWATTDADFCALTDLFPRRRGFPFDLAVGRRHAQSATGRRTRRPAARPVQHRRQPRSLSGRVRWPRGSPS